MQETEGEDEDEPSRLQLVEEAPDQLEPPPLP